MSRRAGSREQQSRTGGNSQDQGTFGIADIQVIAAVALCRACWYGSGTAGGFRARPGECKSSRREVGYTFRAVPCSTLVLMERSGHRLNVTLDPEHAARLARLAERTHVQEGTLARSLLSAALEEADPEARNLVAVLDGIPGAYEHATQSLERARAGETIALDEL